MNRIIASALALAAASAVACADTITQTFTYAWDSNLPEPAFSFQPFDTQGGARQLTTIRLGFAGTMSMEFTASTTDPRGVSAGAWSFEASHTVVAYFNGGGLDHLQGIGGQWQAEITGDIGPGSGGEPGTPFVFTQTRQLSNVVEIGNVLFEGFSGPDPLTGIIAGFFDAVITPPDNGPWIDLLPTFLSQAGTITLTYEFNTSVPSCPADFNGDGTVNPDDLSDFITCFFQDSQSPGACPQADFNADESVNPDDLSDFITTFFSASGC